MTFRVLLNPTAGRGAAARAREVIEPRVGRQQVVVTSGVDHLRHEAWRAADEGLERVVVAGGDGSAHHAIQELAGRRTALAVLPLGSGNDMAVTFGMPRDLRAALEVAITAPSRPTDLGVIGGHHFALYCGFGFDGAVSKTYNEKVRWIRGTPGYVWSALRAMVSFEPPTLVLEHEGGRIERRVMLALAANSPRCGGGMLVAPMARLDSGQLELVVLDAVPRRSLLFLLGKVFRGTHLGHPKVHHQTIRRLTVAADRVLWVYGDGEPLMEVGEKAVEVSVEPSALHVVRGPG